MTDTFSALPGAVIDVASGVPSHYGNPIREQRALAEGQALVFLGHHGVVRVSGPDRLSWLNSMTSQQLIGLQPGESVESLLLDPNGRIERAMRVVDDGESTWLLVDADQADLLTAFLMRMRFALRVEVADVSEIYATVVVFGESTLDRLTEQVTPTVVWHDPWAVGVAGGVQYSSADHQGKSWDAVHVVLPRADLPGLAALFDADGFSPAGTLALQALEVRAWRPNLSHDVDERSLPHEFDWLRTAVHLTKGCYRGQETVAKVHNLGHPPRRLVLLHLDGSAGELPEAGALVYPAGGDAPEEARPVGRVTRAVMHHEWGAIALALVKRNVAEDAPLEVRLSDAHTIVAAQQEIIVPVTAGRTREIPRLRRL